MATMESDPNAFSPVKDIAAPGQKIDGPLLQNMRREVAELLGRNSISFPGAQPVSFARKHLEELTRQE
jgi:mRNA guanylyltransferase